MLTEIAPIILEKVEYLILLIEEKPCEVCQRKNCLLPWLDKNQVMESLKISKTTYYSWLKAGILVPDSTKGEDRYLIETINELIAGKGQRKRLKKRSGSSKD